MPPLSTNIIKDNNTSSAISELDSNQFTHSSGDNEASSDSTLNITTLKLPYKRRQLATFMWQFARDPLPYKAICDSKN